MNTSKLYLDTSVWSFNFADDAPSYRDTTRDFFQICQMGKFKLYCSELVMTEINSTFDSKLKKKLQNKIEEYSPVFMAVNQNVLSLADEYIKGKILSENSYVDALHVALATVHEIDIVLSWNFKHLSNIKRNDLFRAINVLNGYSDGIKIIPPLEVMDYEL